ncbi:FtsX-like permease family protein [Protaetiibacter intestinalis]|uniref:FtsX-like permease family protein n=1 Tax=Protaetiibacter intestinalis TaxID=2419774 RepID=A0A387B0H3_9MICO|nr:FtsX-like permease family protein [Protaetiibacter intestinalis]AYF96984.1 FtsX-like permease family protein [Protaetiibacter intestinalis]
MRRHAGVFGSLLAVAAIVTGLALGVLGIIDRASATGVRAELADRTGEEGALRATLRLTGDPVSSDTRMRAAIADTFRDGDREVPVTVRHELRSGRAVPFTRVDPGDAAASDAPAATLALAGIPDLADAAELTAGRWPASAAEAALQADAATALGLDAGDRIELAGRVLEISGLWRVSDALDPRWVADPLLVSGDDGTGRGNLGPLVVDESVGAAVGADRLDSWTIVPRVAELEPHDLAAIAIAWGAFPDTADALDLGALVDQDGLLAITARDLDRRVRALDATGPASLLLVAMIALVTFVELGRLLSEVRLRELGLLWARGATPGEVAAATAAEAAIAAGAGAALGAGLAATLVAAGDPGGLARLGASWGAIPAGVVAAAVLAVAAHGLLATRRAARPDDPARTGRGQRIAGGGLVVLVALAAGLATWQLRLYGSPVTRDAEGGSSVDAIAVSAPALLVAALALGGLLLFPRIARAAERRASRDPRAMRALVARSLARRLALAATPIALVALAGSQLLVAAGYAGSWERSHAQTHALRAGAELRVDAGPVGLDGTALATLAATPGVDRVAPSPRDLVELADEDVRVVGIGADALRELGLDGGTLDLAALADGIRVAPAGTALPVGAARVAAVLSTPEGLAPVRVTLWLQTADGLLLRADATPGPDGYTVPVPSRPDTEWRLVALDVELPFSMDAFDGIPVELDSLRVDGAALAVGAGWRGTSLFDGSALEATGTNGAVVLPGGGARFMQAGPDRAVPIAVSRTVARLMGSTVGTEFALPLTGGDLRVSVAAIVDGVPGSDRSAAILVDAGTLELAALRSLPEPPDPEVVWVGSAQPAGTAEALRDALGGGVRVVLASDDPVARMLAASRVVFWATAAGSAALALVALGAVAGAQLGSRRDETAVLRALGFSARQQGAQRRRELGAVVGYGALVGLVAGAVVVAVPISTFVRAAIPDVYDSVATEVRVDLLGLAIGAGAFGLAVAILIAGYGAIVERQALGARVPEDSR